MRVLIVGAAGTVGKAAAAALSERHEVIAAGRSTGDITVDPVADAGTSLDGWCPASGGGGGSAPVFTQQLQASTTSLSSAGGSVTLSWTVSGQTGCTASSSGVSGWNGGTVTSPTALTLPANTVVMPGHGVDTTIGNERPHLGEWVARGW